MLDRTALIERFLVRAGWHGARRQVLAADASFRRYDRVWRDGATAVLMDAPPPQEDVRPFLRVARTLRDLGLSAPEPFAADEQAGLLLLEDLGDRTFTRALAAGDDEAALYRLAIDALIALQRAWAERGAAQPAARALPAYDEARLLDEALLLTDWALPALTGRATPQDVRASYSAAWRAVLPAAYRHVPETLVLRDYHVDNLVYLSGRDGIAACGLLDFQDAVLGPASYDVVSLLEDARRDIAPTLAETMLARYLGAFPALDRDAFATSYAVLGTQRAAKIIGIFTRLSRRDGKHQYLAHIPRVWRLLGADLAHPALAPVAEWFDREIPAALRTAPGAGVPE